MSHENNMVLPFSNRDPEISCVILFRLRSLRQKGSYLLPNRFLGATHAILGNQASD
jgi:hypothetical protein